MPRNAHEPAPVKGPEIRIFAGEYKALQAWLNSAKTQAPVMRYVIVKLLDGTEKTTRIRKSSIAPLPPPPRNFEKATLQQMPEIEEHLRKAAQLLAMCGVQEWTHITNLFGEMCIQEEAKLIRMGPKATYYNIYFSNENENEIQNIADDSTPTTDDTTDNDTLRV